MNNDNFIIAGFCILVAILVASCIMLVSCECHTKAEKQGYECEWGMLEGCMIKVDGKWIDYDKWRIME